MSKFLLWLNLFLASVLLLVGLNWLFYYIMGKRSAKVLTQEEFKEGMRKAQVLDVREKDDFNAGHILGARNIPFTVFTQSIAGLRKDQPIYLYDQTKTLSVRAASKLKKNGFTDIYVLKGGYQDWTGKTKAK